MYKLYYRITGGSVITKSFKDLHEALQYSLKLEGDSFLELKYYNDTEIKKIDRN